MKALGDTLQAMKSLADGEREPQRGLTTTGGQSNTELSLRPAPLSQEQLMRIQSLTLQKPPSITSTTRKKYAKKWQGGDDGGYETEVVVGEEECFNVSLSFVDGLTVPALESSLRLSPTQAALAHVTRLSLHKRLGSGKERALLLNDYAEKLKDFSEFSIYLACRYFWESDKLDFAPNLGKLASLVQEIEDELKARLHRLKNPPKAIAKKEPEITRHDKPKNAWSEKDWDDHVEDARGMVSLSEQCSIINGDDWREELARREKEREDSRVDREPKTC